MKTLLVLSHNLKIKFNFPAIFVPFSVFSTINVSSNGKSLYSTIFMVVYFQVIEKLGGFRTCEKVDDKTTHLVIGSRQRTMNMVRAVVRGIWILKYEWILESEKKGEWRLEDVFMQTSIVPSLRQTRMQRTLNDSFKMTIFDEEVFYISKNNRIPVGELIEVVKSVGGKTTKKRTKANFIVASSFVKYPEETTALVVKPAWIFDCIENDKIINTRNYILRAE